MKKLLHISVILMLTVSLYSCEKDELEGCDATTPEMKALELLDDNKQTPSVNKFKRSKTSPNPRENGDAGVNDDGDDESGNPPPVKAK